MLLENEILVYDKVAKYCVINNVCKESMTIMPSLNSRGWFSSLAASDKNSPRGYHLVTVNLTDLYWKFRLTHVAMEHHSGKCSLQEDATKSDGCFTTTFHSVDKQLKTTTFINDLDKYCKFSSEGAEVIIIVELSMFVPTDACDCTHGEVSLPAAK